MRIVSLLPSTTEILFAIGAGEQVAGVTHECDYPPEARTRPVLTSSALEDLGSPREIDRHVKANLHAGSSLYHLHRETLEQLQPDLIVTQELCEVCAVSYAIVDRVARRLASDPRIVSFEPQTLDDVLATIETLGALTGCDAQARTVVSELREQIASLRADRTRDSRRVLFLEWSDPPMSAGHWIPELIQLAGGESLLGNPGAKSRVLGWDDIAVANPDVIAVAPCGFDEARAAVAVASMECAEWLALRAVREGRVLPLDGNAYFSRPGTRLIEGARMLKQRIAAIS